MLDHWPKGHTVCYVVVRSLSMLSRPVTLPASLSSRALSLFLLFLSVCEATATPGSIFFCAPFTPVFYFYLSIMERLEVDSLGGFCGFVFLFIWLEKMAPSKRGRSPLSALGRIKANERRCCMQGITSWLVIDGRTTLLWASKIA
jgi:hypothetical protein